MVFWSIGRIFSHRRETTQNLLTDPRFEQSMYTFDRWIDALIHGSSVRVVSARAAAISTVLRLIMRAKILHSLGETFLAMGEQLKG